MIPGNGVSAMLDGRKILVGKEEFLKMKESRLPAVRISGLICRKAVPLSVLPLTKNISVTLFYLIRLGKRVWKPLKK